MRLALITQDFPPEIGGIQTYCLEIAQRIYDKCDDFIVIAPEKPESDETDSELPFDVYRVRTPNMMLAFAAIPRLLPILKRRKIRTVFHAQWLTLPFSIIAQKAGIIDRITVAAHAREFFFNPFKSNEKLARGYEWYKNQLLKRVDHFFPVSHYTAGVLQDHGISPDKIDVVINGTNPDLFYPADATGLKEQLGLTGRKIILSISRLIDRKGTDTILKALAILAPEMPDLHHVIVGEGPQRTYLEQLVRELNIEDHVTFVGWIPYKEVYNYYNLCDVFVMPSKTQLPEVEAFGIAYLEANACEKPVIGTTTGGISDAIKDGQTGLLVEEQNPGELAGAIQKILGNESLKHSLGQQGRQRVLDEANWDSVTNRLFKLIDKQR